MHPCTCTEDEACTSVSTLKCMMPYTKNALGRPRKLCMRSSTYVHEAVHVRFMRLYTYAT